MSELKRATQAYIFFSCTQRKSDRSTRLRYRQTAGGPETQVVRWFQLGRTTQSVADTANNPTGLCVYFTYAFLSYVFTGIK